MRCYASSENRRRIVRKLGGRVSSATAAAEIGSRVFPLRAPPAASMPSVATRRSTRVFVSRSKEAPRGVDLEASARVLRSGKRLVSSKPLRNRANGEERDGNEWLRLLWWKEDDKKGILGLADGWHKPTLQQETSQSLDSSDGKSFGFVYSRKRARPEANGVVSMSSSTADSELKEDKKYGIVFVRKQRRKRIKVDPSVQEVSGETAVVSEERQVTSTATEIKEWELSILETDLERKSGTLEVDFLTNVGGPVVLAVLIDSCCSSSSDRFSRLLISILRWTRISRLGIRELAALLLSGSMASVFSLHGVHFLPVLRRDNNVMLGNAMAYCGSCIIYGARNFVPILSLDFCALPSYFKSLHVAFMLGALYLPAVLMRYLMGLCTNVSMANGVEEKDSLFYADRGLLGALDAGSVIPPVQGSRSHSIEGALPQNIGIVHCSKLQKFQRKRSSLRHSRSCQPSFMRLRTGVVRSNRKSNWCHSEAKASSLPEPIQVNALDASSGNLFSSIDENDCLTPLRSHGKQKRSATKSPVERIKEKLALAEVKQNIDSVHCKANILVIDTDRCWREEGAQVMLEMSVSNKWCIAVKLQQTTRILHKPLDMKPCIVNRFTHAYMWGVEEGWKLEFLNKWDWLLFKELYMECWLRSSQDVSVKLIPVPGVREVSDYVGNVVVPFLQPDAYIKMKDDEVERALARETESLYEVDSGDEKWLEQLNSNSPDIKNSNSRRILKDDLEKVISTLEKDAYNSLNELPSAQRVLRQFQNLLREDMLIAVYDYWLKKRKKKGAPLVRFFQQGAPLRGTQLIQELERPFLRKKRSFKRQRSQAGRVKSEILLQDGAKEESLRRVQEAENAANRAVESAIHLRNRAQMLMAKAELAAYRSLMALRIAEALQVSEAPDIVSYVLD
ncbi:uncharacterized protein [Typha latifolia]|uniref:uncharacterized protein isoform X1 n=1 Tax=Typha latifolia TaxID=4733 RepID=UPI003C2D7748